MKLLPKSYNQGYNVGCGYGKATGDGYGFPRAYQGFCTGDGFPVVNGWGFYPVKVVLYETKLFPSNP